MDVEDEHSTWREESPATQTLNELSQTVVDMSFSQLEMDVATTLCRTANREDEDNVSIDLLAKSVASSTSNGTEQVILPRAIQVEQIDASTLKVIRVHPSLSAVERAVGIPRWTLSKHLDNERPYQGYIWRRAAKRGNNLKIASRESEGKNSKENKGSTERNEKLPILENARDRPKKRSHPLANSQSTQCEENKKQRNLESTINEVKPSSSEPDINDSIVLSANVTVHKVRVTHQGPLHLQIESGKPPQSLLDELLPLTREAQYCRVSKKLPECALPNVHVDDWFVELVTTQKNAMYRWLDYYAVRHDLAQRERPFDIYLARQETEATQETNSVLPFCIKCRDNSPSPHHHAWCPKNPHFRHSGAEKILNRLREGVKLGCATCQKEYQTGRRWMEPHSSVCQTNEKHQKEISVATLHSPLETGQSEKQLPPSKSSIPENSRNRLSQENALCCTVEKQLSNQDAIETMASHVTMGSAKDLTNESQSKHTTSTNKKAECKKEKKVDTKSQMNKKDGTSSKRLDEQVAVSIENSTRLRNHPSSPLLPGEQKTPIVVNIVEEPVKFSWEKCENPWGPGGFHEEDVIYYSLNRGFGHHEIEAPSTERFAVDPLSNPRYHETHHTAEEGYDVLQLFRDPMAKLPWGFTCNRNEFGNACLVQSIVPFSPADCARYLGESETKQASKLRVNDMVLAINGKQIGGLTVTGLELELDMCGTNLLLVVSRYKFARRTEEEIDKVGRACCYGLDEAINDKRLLNWIDINDTEDTHKFLKPVDEVRRTVSPSERINTDNTIAILEPKIEDISLKGSGKVRPFEDISTTEAPDKESAHADIPTSMNNNQIHPIGAQPVLEGTNRSDNTNSDSETDVTGEESACTDDGNAWLGCICGKVHKRIPVFWIQCDKCNSWYNVAPKCVGFTERDAHSLKKWFCSGCPQEKETITAESASCNISTIFRPIQTSGQNKDDTFAQPRGRRSNKYHRDSRPGALDKFEDCPSTGSNHKKSKNIEYNDSDSTQDPEENARCPESKTQGRHPVFALDTLVYVQKHSWPGVNVEEGLARIIQSYVDDDGDLVYDIKYTAIKGSVKGVLAEYIIPYSLD